MLCSTITMITSGNSLYVLNWPQDRDEPTVFRDDHGTARRLFSPSFHIHREEVMVSYISVGMFAARIRNIETLAVNFLARATL